MQKQPALAIPEFQAAVAIDPTSVDAQANLGVLLFFQGKPAESIPHFRAALAVNKDEQQPGLAKIQGLLGMAESRTLDFANARKDMEAAFPAIQDPRFQLQLGLELVGLYTESGDLEKAAAVIAQLRKADPENAEVLYAAYRTYSDLAGESMLALSLAAPDSAQMHQLLAHEDSRQGNTNGADRAVSEGHRDQPASSWRSFRIGRTAAYLERRGREEGSRTGISRWRCWTIRRMRRRFCRLAELDAQKGNREQSFQEYTKAVALQPADADAKLGVGEDAD